MYLVKRDGRASDPVQKSRVKDGVSIVYIIIIMCFGMSARNTTDDVTAQSKHHRERMNYELTKDI